MKNHRLAFLIAFLMPLGLHAQEATSDVVDADQVTAVENESTVKSTIEAPAPNSSRVEKIEVTGSHIRRTDVEGPSPIVTIDREEIEASGFNSVGAILRGSTSTPFGGNGNTVNLRGLGSARTLILINGHRAPKSGSSYGLRAASANFVPLAAVDRIEILKDGAAATYGSDALGGVVNIITRKNMDGVSFATKYDLSDPIGGDQSRSSLAYAKQSGNSSFLTSLQYTFNQGARTSSFRHRKNSALTTAGSPNLLTAASGGIKAGPNCPAGSIDSASGRCIQDITANIQSLPSNDIGTVTTYTYDFDRDTQFYTTFIGNYSQINSETVGASFGTPGQGAGFTFAGNELSQKATQSFSGKLTQQGGFAQGDGIRLFNRLGGTRVSKDEEFMGGLIVGTKGYWGNSDWSWDVNANNQMFFEHSRSGNQGLFQPTRDAVAAGALPVFSGRAQEQSISGLTADSVVDSRYQVSWVNATSSGEVGNFLGANWVAALGVSGAHFEYSDDRDERVTGGAFMGLSGVEGRGERQLYAGFMELSGLFSKNFETQISLRHDQYSDFGSTLNPKVAFRYQPAKSVTFRGSAGTGFNAPSLQDTYGPKLEGFYNGIVDTKSCKANGPNHPDCDPASFSAELGANRELKQETSVNYNLGVIFEPIKRLNFSIDYWVVEVENTINSGDPQRILELEANGVDISQYGATVTRNQTGGIDRISLFMANAGSEEANGVDVAGGYLLKTSAGDFSLNTSQSYMFNKYQAFYNELGKEQVLGQGGQPRWRNVTSMGYKRGRFGGLLTARTTSRVEKSARNSGSIEQFTQFDVNFDYFLGKSSRLQLGAINVFDQRPPEDETSGARINTALYRPFMTTYLAYRQRF